MALHVLLAMHLSGVRDPHGSGEASRRPSQLPGVEGPSNATPSGNPGKGEGPGRVTAGQTQNVRVALIAFLFILPCPQGRVDWTWALFPVVFWYSLSMCPARRTSPCAGREALVSGLR